MSEEIIIDSKNKSLGRLATLISHYLQGKHRSDYSSHKDEKIVVILKNLDKVKFTGKKFNQDFFVKHTGYIGHLKEIPLKNLWLQNKLKVIRMIVSKMLPKNKLRKGRLLRIKLLDDDRNRDN